MGLDILRGVGIYFCHESKQVCLDNVIHLKAQRSVPHLELSYCRGAGSKGVRGIQCTSMNCECHRSACILISEVP